MARFDFDVIGDTHALKSRPPEPVAVPAAEKPQEQPPEEQPAEEQPAEEQPAEEQPVVRRQENAA